MQQQLQAPSGCLACNRIRLGAWRRPPHQAFRSQPSCTPTVVCRRGRLAQTQWRRNAADGLEEASTSGRGGSPGSSGNPTTGISTMKIIYKKVLKELSSLPRAIALMLSIAALSGLGTFIEQNKGLDYYVQNYPDGPQKVLGFLTWQWIVGLQLDHLYTSWYFLLLLGVMAASLAACTVTRQWPIAKVAQRWRFATRREVIAAIGPAEVLPNARLSDLAALLMQRNYQVFVKGQSLYAFQGMSGRWAPIGVHAALLLVLGGTAWSGLGGWKGSVMVPEGQEFLVRDALLPASPLAPPPSGSAVAVRVNSFEVDYRPNGAPAQFYSDLSVVEPARDGPAGERRELARQRISVNIPLRYGGVTMYQTDWALSQVNLRVAAAGSDDVTTPVELPMASLEGRDGISGKLWASFLPVLRPDESGDTPRGISFLARDLQSVAVYDSQGKFVGVRRPGSGKALDVEGLRVVVDRVLGSTGMEIKSDPGVPIVYAGFGGTMITVVLCYITHSQVWALQEGEALLVTGKTNRAQFAFKREFDELLDSVPEVLPSAAPGAVAAVAPTDAKR